MDSSASSASAVVVACPSCHALVRVPGNRLADNPVCGKCKAHILEGRPFALDAASFTTHTERAELPVLVDFWASWCGPCKMMEPVLERTANQWRARLHVAKVNTDEQSTLAARFAIRAIPTLILFHHGKEIARQSGAMDGAALSRWLDSALSRTAAA